MNLTLFFDVGLTLMIVDVLHLLGVTYLFANDEMFSKVPLEIICAKIGKIFVIGFVYQMIVFYVVSTIFL